METQKDTLTPEARFVFNLFVNNWTEEEVKKAYEDGWIKELFNSHNQAFAFYTSPPHFGGGFFCCIGKNVFSIERKTSLYRKIAMQFFASTNKIKILSKPLQKIRK